MTPYKKKKLSVKSRLNSFQNAMSGLVDMLSTEPNAWLHLIATIIVLFLSWWLQISAGAFLAIVIAIGGVWMAEAFNTVLEIVVDIVSSGEYSVPAKRAKDIAAAAVLIWTLAAALIGLIVLGPPLYARLQPYF